ncbi:MAG: tRNA (adenosine(37)-N6)-threonylcarbamoyltransferase complex ATPase subunit type 1 TsaE [Bacteroidetes bacterium RBG_19FT_COMBO_42_7]|nr:MAG: tRNA (adenosine(37)-N6)-threonylcarbamoyltransferase complex ATPase subunit type 1 TsaE [Bacteroidetes bacterium RBG_13_42_15]OFY73546.1 MAG: tRNA (adenosine(37)-N6)-threonylcarbamoyltransferase complex ATPase subunit type 1 TsaE [Bacteroidetes bacterium RBG_19FT_COMBO_42_7]
MKIVIKHKKYLPVAARRILEYTSGKKLLAFYGSMGAGKTTIIKAVCKILGAEDIVTSPTFTLVNEYRTTTGEVLYHIDFYRINKKEEVLDLGIEEYFNSGSYCLMEWPELIGEILPPETVIIKITVDKKEYRVLEIS